MEPNQSAGAVRKVLLLWRGAAARVLIKILQFIGLRCSQVQTLHPTGVYRSVTVLLHRKPSLTQVRQLRNVGGSFFLTF